MEKKLQQFYIMSFQSSYIKKIGKVECTISDCRKNSQIISVADSQLLRTIREQTGHPYNKEKLSEMWLRRKKIKNKKNKKEHVQEIIDLSKAIDDMLFITDVISITFNHSSHYVNFVKNGVIINGDKYVRFMAGAGQLRRSTVLFIKENLWEKITNIFENGMNKEIPLGISKYSAYMGLYSSSTHVVTTPRYIVVPDREIVRKNELVHYVNNDNTVEKKKLDVKLNVFDGQGLVSIEMAKKWTEDLGLDYDGIEFLVRFPFGKGLMVAFPFQTLAKENGIKEITDVYGEKHKVDEVDCIVTASQFKMLNHYSSVKQHRENSEKNNLLWGVSRVNPKKEKSHFFTSYQYIQTLKNTVDVEDICSDTIKYFNEISSFTGVSKSLIYLMGDSITEDVEFGDIDNYLSKILSLNEETINDTYVKKTIIRTLNRKILDSYSGKLMVRGNYQFLISDPYALSQHALGMEVTGMLKDGESYSSYWNDLGVSKVSSGRSPLTWVSENNILNFVKAQHMKKWYSHLYTGIIINSFGIDVLLWADADFDGDMVWTSDNRQLVNNVYGGIPVTYEKKPVPKVKLDYSKIYLYDLKSFGTKIGLVTNYSTTTYCLLDKFDENSDEYKEGINRLIVCRKLQGEQIDSTKGLEVGKIPDWSKRVQGDDIHNKLLLKTRPYFMKYLYHNKLKEFETHHRTYNIYCWALWGMSIDDLHVLENKNQDQKKLVERYEYYSPLILDSNSIMDRVSKHMVNYVKELKAKSNNDDFNYAIYMDMNVGIKSYLREPMIKLIKEYNRLKKNLFFLNENSDKEQVVEYIKNKAFELSSDLAELTNMAVLLCYNEKHNPDFVHSIFQDGILNNLMKNNKYATVPILDEHGDIEFAYKTYRMAKIKVGE